VLTLSSPERDLLTGWLPDQLRGVYDADASEKAARQRLFPVAYLDPTEEDAESEWQALVHPELLRARLESLARVVTALEGAEAGRRGTIAVELGPDDISALLGVLNDARLALGTLLGVTEDTELGDLDPADPVARSAAIYLWLTHIEGDLVETLLGDLPD
jgi:hypothetical protein